MVADNPNLPPPPMPDDYRLQVSARASSSHTLRMETSGLIRAEIAKPAGVYVIGEGFAVETVTRPSWLHRTMAKLLLGWRWMPKP